MHTLLSNCTPLENQVWTHRCVAALKKSNWRRWEGRKLTCMWALIQCLLPGWELSPFNLCRELEKKNFLHFWNRCSKFPQRCVCVYIACLNSDSAMFSWTSVAKCSAAHPPQQTGECLWDPTRIIKLWVRQLMRWNFVKGTEHRPTHCHIVFTLSQDMTA